MTWALVGYHTVSFVTYDLCVWYKHKLYYAMPIQWAPDFDRCDNDGGRGGFAMRSNSIPRKKKILTNRNLNYTLRGWSMIHSEMHEVSSGWCPYHTVLIRIILCWVTPPPPYLLFSIHRSLESAGIPGSCIWDREAMNPGPSVFPLYGTNSNLET